MFKPAEQPVFEWVDEFVRKHHALPQLVTLEAKFPDMVEIVAPEPPSYYREHLENRYYYDLINNANLESQALLKEKPTAINEAMKINKDAVSAITKQRYRARIVNVSKEGPGLVLKAYHDTLLVENVAEFGWPYMDHMSGGMLGGDLVSVVGRPASGKTFLVVRGAMHNWRKKKKILLVSMEMNPLSITQRIAAMYAHTNLTQLKLGAYSNTPVIKGGTSTYKKFVAGLKGISTEEGDLWVVDGNLAASPEDIYELAAQMDVDAVYIDGAYLLRHKNPRLGRYEKVAENTETMKASTTDLEIPTFASWQFSREATKKKDNKQVAGLEDIAYSDAIGQTSSVVLGLFQEESVETLLSRKVQVMKGRNGEIGSFNIAWDFNLMNFNELVETDDVPKKLEFV